MDFDETLDKLNIAYTFAKNMYTIKDISVLNLADVNKIPSNIIFKNINLIKVKSLEAFPSKAIFIDVAGVSY